MEGREGVLHRAEADGVDLAATRGRGRRAPPSLSTPR